MTDIDVLTHLEAIHAEKIKALRRARLKARKRVLQDHAEALSYALCILSEEQRVELETIRKRKQRLACNTSR